MEKYEEKIQRILHDMVAQGASAGANVLVLREGREMFYADAGFADKSCGKPIERNTIFRLYSMTKPLTALALLCLMEEGRVDLADEVSRYLPAFSKQVVATTKEPPQREMTLFHLLSMTAGLTYGGTESETEEQTQALFDEVIAKMDTADRLSTVEFANRLAEIPLAFAPGEHWCYGTSADVLGAVVETVSEMDLGMFLRARVFEPLGMEDTDFFVSPEKQCRLAKVYSNSTEGLMEYRFNHLGISNTMTTRPRFMSGGAGLVSTVDDYGRFATMLLQGGMFNGRRVITERTAAYFTGTVQRDALRKDMEQSFLWMKGFNYGNLMRVCQDPSQAVLFSNKGEYGWDGWLGTVFINDPTTRTTFLMMQQTENGGYTTFARRIKNVILSAE